MYRSRPGYQTLDSTDRLDPDDLPVARPPHRHHNRRNVDFSYQKKDFQSLQEAVPGVKLNSKAKVVNYDDRDLSLAQPTHSTSALPQYPFLPASFQNNPTLSTTLALAHSDDTTPLTAPVWAGKDAWDQTPPETSARRQWKAKLRRIHQLRAEEVARLMVGVGAVVLPVLMVGFLVSVLFLKGTSSFGFGETTLHNTKPNILLIVADGLGYNDVQYLNPDVQLPYNTTHIDALAKGGVKLERYYSPSASTPSRCAILTGMHSTKTGCTRDLKDGVPWGVDQNIKLVSNHLKSVGYHTGIVGKWHLGYFTSQYMPLSRGFDEFVGQVGDKRDPLTHQDNKGNFDWYSGNSANASATGDHSDAIIQSTVLTFLKKNRKRSPWFLYVPSTSPGNKYNAPSTDQNEYLSYGDSGSATVSFLAQMADLDKLVGAVVAQLKSTHQLSNTVIVFVGSHGATGNDDVTWSGALGRNYPFNGNSGTLYEGGVRTPAFIYSPKLSGRRGLTVTMPTAAVDLLPTFCAWAGASCSGTDGIDLSSALLKGKEDHSRELLLGLDTSCDQNENNGPTAGLIYNDYKVMADCLTSDSDSSATYYLYHLASDPTEQQNLVQNATFQYHNHNVLSSMKQRLLAYVSDAHPALTNAAPFAGDDYFCSACYTGCASDGVWAPFYSTDYSFTGTECEVNNDDNGGGDNNHDDENMNDDDMDMSDGEDMDDDNDMNDDGDMDDNDMDDEGDMNNNGDNDNGENMNNDNNNNMDGMG